MNECAMCGRYMRTNINLLILNTKDIIIICVASPRTGAHHLFSISFHNIHTGKIRRIIHRMWVEFRRNFSFFTPLYFRGNLFLEKYRTEKVLLWKWPQWSIENCFTSSMFDDCIPFWWSIHLTWNRKSALYKRCYTMWVNLKVALLQPTFIGIERMN